MQSDGSCLFRGVRAHITVRAGEYSGGCADETFGGLGGCRGEGSRDGCDGINGVIDGSDGESGDDNGSRMVVMRKMIMKMVML